MAESVADTGGRIEQLLSYLNRPQALAQATVLRERAAAVLPDWGHTQFVNESLQIDRLLQVGQLQPAYEQASSPFGKG